MRQVEVSRTIVFDAPHRARSFFEALIADNLDLGRPENVEIIFGRRVRCDTPGTFRTAIDRPVIDPDDKGVVVNIFYKHSRVKQYLKQGRAMRIETVINCPRDLRCNARLPNLAELQDKARAINRRILEAERAGQGTVLAPAPPRRPHQADRAHQHLRPDNRRHQIRRLLHQAAQQAAPPAHGRRPGTGARTAPAGPSALATNVHRVGHAALGFGRPQRCWRSLRIRARSRRWAASTSG